MSPPSRWDSFPPPSRPRPVVGGLTARSARGDIGEHWWSRRFVAVLESFALGSRLTRGRNYARRGQVISLTVAPGEVTAAVQGSRRTPYAVRIGLPTFGELSWAKLEVALAEQALFSAALLAGELPPELEAVFAAAGAALFPASADELSMSCSCPDWEVPCKHLSAAFYLLAERFDQDPFQILHWRGRDRPVLLGRLRQLRGDPPAGPAAAAGLVAADVPRAGALLALADLDLPADPAGVDPATFWAGAPLPPLPPRPALPTDLVLRQLPVPGPALGGADLLAQLRLHYLGLAALQT